MFERLENLYKLGYIDENGLKKSVEKNWITEEQKLEILQVSETAEDK